ncbi:MAG: uroporphyrinogen decarboxylase family protein [Thermoproteota archaeon]
MNAREKFVRILRFERLSEIPFPCLFYKFHPETLKRWQREGLPKDVHLIEYLGLERCELIPVNVGPLPNYEAAGLEEVEEWRLGVDRSFYTSLESRIRNVEAEFPIRNIKDYEIFKGILNPDSPARYPRFWDDYVRMAKGREYPLGVSLGSPLSWLVEWIGLKGIASNLKTDPSWIISIVHDLANFITSTVRRALHDLSLDFAIFLEPRAYRLTCIANTDWITDVCKKAYDPIVSWVKNVGIDLVGIESQGCMHELIETWARIGINFISLEASNGGDIEWIRKTLNSRVAIIGNIDHRVLAWSKRDIMDEVSRKMWFFEQGGYIPAPDGVVLPEVSWENFKYFIKILKDYKRISNIR